MKLVFGHILKNSSLLIILLFLQIICKSCDKKEKVNKTTLVKITEINSAKKTDSVKVDLDNFYLFSVNSIENKGNFRTFISLSDLYRDSLTVPPEYITNQKNIPFETLKRIELPEFYRQKLLNGTGFKETEFLFIYNYEKNKLEKHPLKNLKAVANLNVYSDKNDTLLDYYYQIGFELNEKYKVDVENPFYYNSLVYIGEENPFLEEGLSRIKWKKIADKDFTDKKTLRFKNLKLKGTYGYSDEDNHYYVQDYADEEYRNQRFLKVVNRKTGSNFSKVFDNNDEGSELTDLNGIQDPEYTDYQFTGKLFKDKPAVIFNFVNSSFGCPEIIFLDNAYPSLNIECDNRH